MRFSREIYEYGLPHRAVTVYMYLSNRAGKKKECFPSVKTIAEDLRLSKSTVFRALNDLENAGLSVRNGIEQAEDEAPLFIGLKVEKTAVLWYYTDIKKC